MTTRSTGASTKRSRSPPERPHPTTFVQKRIDNAITSTLTSKGWQPVTSDPNIVVYPHVVLSEQTQLNTMNMGGYGYRGWGGMGGGMTTTTVQKIPIGTLVVDLVDPATKEMVWRGTASDQVSGKGEDQGKVDEAMQKLFKNFPPAPGQQVSTGSTFRRPGVPAAGR